MHPHRWWLALALGALACAPAGGVVGRLVDAQQTPQSGVRVSFIRDRGPIAESRTDAEGRFQLDVDPGEGAVFGLTAGDRGVWRDDVAVREQARVDVGDLEVHPVSSHEAVRWLRGVGFDEQLTRGEDALTLLSGGVPGQPLVAVRQGRAALEVFRVEDDGTPMRLVEVPGVLASLARVRVDASGVRTDFGGVTPLFVVTEPAPDGRPVVLIQRGGFTVTTATGASLLPIEQVQWVDALTGQVLLDVPVPPTHEAVVVPSRGVLAGPSGARRWFALGAAGSVAVENDGPGELFAVGQSIARLTSEPGTVRLDRLEGAAFIAGRPVEVPPTFSPMHWFVDGETVGLVGRVSPNAVALVLFHRAHPGRVDVRSLEGDAGGTLRNAPVAPLCDDGPGAAVFGISDDHLRVVRATREGLSVEDTPLPTSTLTQVSELCVTRTGWWAAGAGGLVRRLVRRGDTGVDRMDLDGDVAITRVGRFAVQSRSGAPEVDLVDALRTFVTRRPPFRIPGVLPRVVQEGWMLGTLPTARGVALVRTPMSGGGAP